LRKAWVAAVNDDGDGDGDGDEEASPLVYRVNVFVSTAHDDVLAFDDTTGKLPWAFRAINTQRFWRTCSPTTAFTPVAAERAPFRRTTSRPSRASRLRSW